MKTDRFFSVEWWNRNWKWALSGCGCGLAVFVALFVAGMLAFTTTVMRSSGGYQQAVERIKNDCEVQQRLGVPIEVGWFVSGTTSTTGASGRSELSFWVKGPRGKGTVYLIANKRAGRWEFERLELEPKEGPRLNLLGPLPECYGYTAPAGPGRV